MKQCLSATVQISRNPYLILDIMFWFFGVLFEKLNAFKLRLSHISFNSLSGTVDTPTTSISCNSGLHLLLITCGASVPHKQEDFQMPASYSVFLIFRQVVFHLKSPTHPKRLHCSKVKRTQESTFG